MYLARISHTFVGRNEQTLTLPELRPQRCGHFREQGVNTENCVCAVPARNCDLVPAYGEKCGLAARPRSSHGFYLSQFVNASGQRVSEVIGTPVQSE